MVTARLVSLGIRPGLKLTMLMRITALAREIAEFRDFSQIPGRETLA